MRISSSFNFPTNSSAWTFHVKVVSKSIFFGPDSDPCLPLSLSVRQPCWNFFSLIVVGFVKRNTWISLSCYIYGFIYSYWYTYTPSTNGWSSSLLVDTRKASFVTQSLAKISFRSWILSTILLLGFCLYIWQSFWWERSNPFKTLGQ